MAAGRQRTPIPDLLRQDILRNRENPSREWSTETSDTPALHQYSTCARCTQIVGTTESATAQCTTTEADQPIRDPPSP
jgi:hypothetical protein